MLGCALHCVCQDSSSQVQEDVHKGVNQNAALAAWIRINAINTLGDNKLRDEEVQTSGLFRQWAQSY